MRLRNLPQSAAPRNPRHWRWLGVLAAVLVSTLLALVVNGVSSRSRPEKSIPKPVTVEPASLCQDRNWGNYILIFIIRQHGDTYVPIGCTVVPDAERRR